MLLKKRMPMTNGEKNLARYGSFGIRGEAIKGYPSIWEIAYPILHQGVAQKRDYNLVKLHTLFHIISNLEDSNILARKDKNTLEMIQKQAGEFLEKGGAYNPGNVEYLYRMDQSYIEHNISPGGAADILATAIFMEKVLNE